MEANQGSAQVLSVVEANAAPSVKPSRWYRLRATALSL
jgi:hypothetical protein